MADGVTFRMNNTRQGGHKMRNNAFGILLLATVVFLAVTTSADASLFQTRYMAFCDDGDGAITGWVTNRDDAYLAGRDHERNFRGHRWEILTENVHDRWQDKRCSAFSEGSRPGILKLNNVCGQCKVFRMRRTMGSNAPTERDVMFKPKGSRYFRTQADWQLEVIGEEACPK